jgi:predicted GIY-YIG superfamily endonuclease
MVQGFVYILKSDFGVYKIGRTKDLERRLRDFRIFPKEFELVHSIACEDEVKVEKDLHERYKDKKVRNEWFELSDDDIQDLKKINYVPAEQSDYEIIRLSKEQKETLFELLLKYAAEKENQSSETDVNINHPLLSGEIVTRSFRSYSAAFDDFSEFCKCRNESQRDLLALALVEFMDRYR